MAVTAMAGATVAMVATDMVAGTARGLLMLRLSPDTDTMAAMAVDMVVMAVDTDTVATAAAMVATVATTARGLLMPSLRLMLLLRLSPVTVIVAAMAATAADTTAMARGLLSLAMAMAATAGATVAMAA